MDIKQLKIMKTNPTRVATLRFKTQAEAENSKQYIDKNYFRFYECSGELPYCIDLINLGHCVGGQYLIQVGDLLN